MAGIYEGIELGTVTPAIGPALEVITTGERTESARELLERTGVFVARSLRLVKLNLSNSRDWLEVREHRQRQGFAAGSEFEPLVEVAIQAGGDSALEQAVTNYHVWSNVAADPASPWNA